jgi:lipid-A-disaccharide synthase
VKIMLSAGEASGDLTAGYLAEELLKLEPEVELFGMGGPKMAASGVKLLEDPTGEGVLGFVESLKALPRMKRLLKKMETALGKKPDCLVLVDFPGFNMKLAQSAQAYGIPTVYYFAPQAWIWGRGRAKKVAENSQLVLSVFPPEAEVYRQAGANVSYVGHPLVDLVKAKDRDVRAELGIASTCPLVALLPGSRPLEIKSLLPRLLSAARLVKAKIPSCEFVISLASSIPQDVILEQTKQLPFPVSILEGGTYELLAQADCAVIASGTATLEAALLGTPMVIVYRPGIFTTILGRLLLKLPYFGLPNILLKEEVVPELLQDQAESGRIAHELFRFLTQDNSQLRNKLLSVRELLGTGGAVRRAAEEIIELARGGENSADTLYSK